MARTLATNRAPVGSLGDYIKSLNGLTAYYPMDETEGLVCTDVKSGLNGNIINLNRLPNGNMEGDYGWEDYLAPTTNERSSTIVRGGTYSRHIVVSASNKGAIGTTISVVEGHTYRVSGYVYTVAGSTGKARLRRNTAKIDFTLTGTKTGEWELLTADVVAGASGTETMRLEGSGAGEFYFDDCSIIDLADSDNTITNASGLVGKAYQFDGVNDYVEFPNNAVFSPATTGKFTMFAIIKPDALATFLDSIDAGEQGNYVHLIGKSESSASEFVLRLYDQTGTRPNRVAFYVFEPAGGEGIGGYFQDTLRVGEPIFITATVDGKYVSIYKNGVLRQSTDYTIDQGYAGPLTLGATSSPVRIGTTTLNTSDFGWFQGTIQHLGFLNRALSADEITVLNKKVQTGLATSRSAATNRNAAVNRTAV